MQNCVFLQPNVDGAVFYTNPIDLQRFAGALEEREDVILSFYDLNASASLEIVQGAVSAGDLLVINTPGGFLTSQIKAFLRGFISSTGQVLLVGETVTDGLTEALMRDIAIPGRELFAFVGRSEDRFVDAAAAIALNRTTPFEKCSDLRWLSADGTYRASSSVRLAPTTARHPLHLDENIIEASFSRGLFILLDGVTRGCEYHCLYCHLNNSNDTAGVVQALGSSAGDVMASLSARTKRRLFTQFTDENFFGSNDRKSSLLRFSEINSLAQRLKDLGYAGIIGVDTRCDTVINNGEEAEVALGRAECWRTFYGAGLRYVYLGVESLVGSQLHRYGKSLSDKNILPAIEFLRALNISYTVGLILLDPLVSAEELTASIDIIEEHNLYENVASLLKEMRVQKRSPYFRLLSKGLPQCGPSENYIYLDRSSVKYSDAVVADLVVFVRRVHSIFSGSGYRHSDIASLRALLPSEISSRLLEIPLLITHMEIKLLRYHLSAENENVAIRWQETRKICQETLDRVEEILASDIDSLNDPTIAVIHKYFEVVFGNLRLKLALLTDGGLD